jgi:hypothetical protein
MQTPLRTTIYALLLLLSANVGISQVATGIYTYGTYDNQGFDTINVGNLNVHFAMPVLHKSGRGAPFTYDLGYDSSVWVPVDTSGTTVWVPAQNWGWQGSTEMAAGYITEVKGTTVCQRTAPIGYSTLTLEVVYHDQWGISHPFPGSYWTQSLSCGSPTSGGTIGPMASDGSGYQYPIENDNEIIDKNGKKFYPPVNFVGGIASTADANGNEISVDGSGNFTDTTGNVVLRVAGGSPSPQTFTYTDTTGTPRSVTMTYKAYTVQTAFGCSGVGEYGPTSNSLVDTISYADGSTYTFSYEQTPGVPGNVTGRLASVELPQNGIINYTYTGNNGTTIKNGIVCLDGSTAGLTRVLASDSGSAASSWTYSRTTGPNTPGDQTSHTEVVDGLSNHKAYDFV